MGPISASLRLFIHYFPAEKNTNGGLTLNNEDLTELFQHLPPDSVSLYLFADSLFDQGIPLRSETFPKLAVMCSFNNKINQPYVV